MIEAVLIHWPHIINTSRHATEFSRFREAGPSDRPQKVDNSYLELKLLHYEQTIACSGSWLVIEYSVLNGNTETASPCGRPKIFFCYLSVFAVDVADDDELPASIVDFIGDGKLGYGFTSADELEEVDIGPGDKPRPTFISKKLDPSLREPMIALLREYRDCFTWDYTKMPGLDRSIGSRSIRDFGRFSNQHVR